MTTITDKTIEQDRAYENRDGISLSACTVSGGDAFWQSRSINCDGCTFTAPRALWMSRNAELDGCEIKQNSRDAFWYATDMTVSGTKICGAAAFRECKNTVIKDCEIASDEFGQYTDGARITDSTISGGQILLRSKNIAARRLDVKGKYAFLYLTDGIIMDSKIDTVSGLWHSKGVTIENCVIIGENFGWFSTGLTLKNCTIIGANPLCYCKKLHLDDCVMQRTPNAFECSEVYAILRAELDSVKNPLKGIIRVPAAGEIVRTRADAKCKVLIDPALARKTDKE